MHFKRTLTSFAFSALVAGCLTSPAWAVNIVQNPGFETGTLANWTVNTASSDPWEIDTAGGHGNNPFAGTYFASTGCVGPQCITGTAAQQASLSQVLATTNGQTYTLTFWFYTGGNGAPNELDVMWDGTSVLDLGPGGTLGLVSAYAQYTVSNLAGTGADTLTFLGRQDPGWDGLDNIDVEGGAVVVGGAPEPSTLLLIGSVLPLLAVLRRRLL